MESLKKLGKGITNNAVEIIGSIDHNTNQIVDEIGKIGVNTSKKLFGKDVSEVSNDIYHSSKNVFEGVKKVKGLDTHKLLKDSFVLSAKEASKEFAKKISKEKKDQMFSDDEEKQIQKLIEEKKNPKN